MYKKFTAAVKFQYHKDSVVLLMAKACRQDVFLCSKYQMEHKAFASPRPRENGISILLVNNPKKTSLLSVNLLFMATRLLRNVKSPEEMLVTH